MTTASVMSFKVSAVQIDKHGYDLATLGDVWVGPAMARGLLSPIPGARDSDWWSSLPPKLQQTCTRNRQGFPDANGEAR